MENFEDLSEEAQNMLLEREIIFQDKKISLNKLISSEQLNQIIDAESLVELKMNQEIKIGTKHSTTRVLDGAYCTLFEEINIKAFIKTLQHDDQNIYIISGIPGSDKKETLLKHLNENFIDKSIKTQITDFEEIITRIINTKLQIFDNHFELKQFRKICEQNFDKRIYWLKLHESKFKLTKIYKPDFYLEAKRFNDQVVIDRNIEQLLSSPILLETFIFINITRKQLTSWLQFSNERKKFEFDLNCERRRIQFVTTSKENSLECILRDTFQLIVDENPKESVHLLEFRRGQIVLLKTHGSLEELSKHRSEKYKIDKSLLLDDRELWEKVRNQKCVIIGGGPGVGKSTSLIKLLEKFESEESHWVFRIDLEMEAMGHINFWYDDNDASDNDANDNDANLNDPKGNDAKSNDPKSNDANVNDPKNNDAHVTDPKGNDPKDNDANDDDAFGSLLMALSLSSLSLGSDTIDSDATDDDANDDNNHVNTEKLADFLLDLQQTQKAPITKNLLNLALRDEKFKRPPLLAFDGFDNLDENNRGKIISLLKFLKEKTPVKLLLTTRSNCLQILEGSLSTFTVKLEPFDVPTTTEFIGNYLNNFTLPSSTTDDDLLPNTKNHDDLKRKGSTFVQSLLAKMQKVFNCSDFGNPSLINLILDGSAKHFQTWLRDREKLPDFGYLGNDLWEVVENFIERSYEIYFLMNSEGNVARRKQDRVIFDKYHKDLAKFLLFKSVKTELEELKEIVSSVGTVRYQVNSTQSINFTDGGNLTPSSDDFTPSLDNFTPSSTNFTPSSTNFTHPLFRDYFSSKIFINWTRKWNRENGSNFPNTEKRKFFTSQVLVDPDFRVVRKFLNTYFLKERPKDVCFEKELHHPTILFRAIEENNSGIVNFVLDNFDQMDLNSTDDYGSSLLCTAVASANFDTVQLLVRLGATIDATVLHTAVAMANLQVVKFLLQEGADVNWEDALGRKILQTAVDSNFFQSEFESVSEYKSVSEPKAESEAVSKSVSESTAKSVSESVSKTIPEFGSIPKSVSESVSKTISVAESASVPKYVSESVSKTESGSVPKSVSVAKSESESKTVSDYGPVSESASKSESEVESASEVDNLKMVRLLIEHGADIHAKDKYSKSLLEHSVEMSNFTMIEFLLRKNFDVNARNCYGRSTLYYAFESGNLRMVEFLLNKGADINIEDNYKIPMWTIGFETAKIELVDFLLKLGINLDLITNHKDYSQKTLLHTVALGGDLQTFAFLVKNGGANLNAKDNNGKSVLHCAVMKANYQIVEFLIQHDAKCNAKDTGERSVLHYAVEYGTYKIVDYLVQNGANVNDKNGNGVTILHCACKFGDWRLVDFLVQNNAVVNVKDKDGKSALHYAVERGDLRIVKYLVKHRAKVNERDKYVTSVLHSAAGSGNLEMVKFLAANGANVRARDKGGRSVLHKAVTANHLGIVKFLLNDMNKDEVAHYRDNFETTLLHTAARNGNFEMVRLLTEQGANVNAKNRECYSILHNATESGKLEMVEFLVKLGAKVNSADKRGRTTLHKAAEFTNIHMVKFLVEEGANVLVGDENDRTILHIAANRGDFEMVNFLLRKGAVVNAKDDEGRSVLHCAAENGNQETVELLIEKGANVHCKDQNGRSILQSAIIFNHSNLVQLLLDQCEDQIKYKNKMGCTLIHYACETDNFEIAEFLLQRGADINEKYKDGSSLLHYATKYADMKLMEFLLKHGVDIHAKDKNGKTALQYVSDTIYNYSYSWRYDPKTTIELLTDNGADINSLDVNDFYYRSDVVEYIKAKQELIKKAQEQKTEE